MKAKLITAALGLVLSAASPLLAAELPPSITTPDKVESSVGTLDFKDGAPSTRAVHLRSCDRVHPFAALHARLV